jgi:hypothetical protein
VKRSRGQIKANYEGFGESDFRRMRLDAVAGMAEYCPLRGGPCINMRDLGKRFAPSPALSTDQETVKLRGSVEPAGLDRANDEGFGEPAWLPTMRNLGAARVLHTQV